MSAGISHSRLGFVSASAMVARKRRDGAGPSQRGLPPRAFRGAGLLRRAGGQGLISENKEPLCTLFNKQVRNHLALMRRSASATAASNCCSSCGDAPRMPATTSLPHCTYWRCRSTDQSEGGVVAYQPLRRCESRSVSCEMFAIGSRATASLISRFSLARDFIIAFDTQLTPGPLRRDRQRVPASHPLPGGSFLSNCSLAMR